MMPWKQGLVWDVTCPDTLTSSHLNQAVTGPGVVATAAEARKRLKYEVISRTYKFSPIAIETFGALGKEAAEFFKDLAVCIKSVTK
jgi:glutamate dehydrogenase/leucine dehydrogenase